MGSIPRVQTFFSFSNNLACIIFVRQFLLYLPEKISPSFNGPDPLNLLLGDTVSLGKNFLEPSAGFVPVPYRAGAKQENHCKGESHSIGKVE